MPFQVTEPYVVWQFARNNEKVNITPFALYTLKHRIICARLDHMDPVAFHLRKFSAASRTYQGLSSKRYRENSNPIITVITPYRK